MGLNLGEKTNLGYLVILRLWIGSYLLYQGSRKFLRDFPNADWVTRQIGEMDKVELFSWYKSFLMNVVIPNRELFGYLVMYGEILIGICLIIGLLTRFSSAVGIFVFLNYMLGPGMARGGATSGQTQTFFVAMIVLFLTNPGRTLGVDGLLFKRR
ncbi:MAG: DoxX family membrane protein [Deltaproteobacteria bacterium]|nr:DoxX family membrane protein [Deltaproteobacteria bacterium]